MVLNPPNNDKLKEVLHLHEYHPYWIDKAARVKNPAFNADDSMILNVKIDREPGAIRHFAGIIGKLACADIVVAVVPGHQAGNATPSGIGLLAREVAGTDGRTDGTSLLVRTKSIDKLASGGDRSIEVHLNSIRVVDKHGVLKDASVLLLDDVTTSNNSLRACKQLLRAAGAKQVQMLALGRTVR